MYFVPFSFFLFSRGLMKRALVKPKHSVGRYRLPSSPLVKQYRTRCMRVYAARLTSIWLKAKKKKHELCRLSNPRPLSSHPPRPVTSLHVRHLATSRNLNLFRINPKHKQTWTLKKKKIPRKYKIKKIIIKRNPISRIWVHRIWKWT